MQRDQVVIVTGAASGIGKTIALEFAKSGYSVFLVDKDLYALESIVKKDFSNYSYGYYCCDVSNASDVNKGFEKCITQFGQIDVLVSNAAIMIKKQFLELKEEDWEQTIDVNLKGVFLWGQKVARWMVSNNRKGKIINISCMRAKIATPGISAYIASKGGVSALTKAMAVELSSNGINVNAVEPGRTITEGLTQFLHNDERRKKLESLIPMQRIANPEEIANLVLFLASEKASYITGATIPIDGGYTISKE